MFTAAAQLKCCSKAAGAGGADGAGGAGGEGGWGLSHPNELLE